MGKARDLESGRAEEMGCFFSRARAGVLVPLEAPAESTSDPELRQAQLGKDFSFEGLVFEAKVVKVVDGDTLRAVFRPDPHGPLVQHRVRLEGCNAPELHPPLGMAAEARAAEVRGATAAREALRLRVEGQLVRLVCGRFDKYGRLLAVVSDGPGLSVNAWLVELGHARPLPSA